MCVYHSWTRYICCLSTSNLRMRVQWTYFCPSLYLGSNKIVSYLDNFNATERKQQNFYLQLLLIISIFPLEEIPTACPFKPITSLNFVFESVSSHCSFHEPECTRMLSSNWLSLFRMAKRPTLLKLVPICFSGGSLNDWKIRAVYFYEKIATYKQLELLMASKL